MKFDVESFRNWKTKRITLLGMSGVGKTHLSTMLRSHDWYHYSGDYRIGTRYLDEAILDLVKHEAMKTPLLAELLRNDWIYIRNNIKVHDLGPVLSYVGKLGDPARGGVELDDFVARQAHYREGEIAAMHDVPRFIDMAQEVYGYQNFVNDVGGSLCELEDQAVIDLLVENTLILYIKTTNAEEEDTLIRRAQSDPKPLYYRPEFLQEQLAIYLKEQGLSFASEMEPDAFTRWVFPRLFHSRLPRYDAIAEPYGYTVTSKEVAEVSNEADFLALLEKAIARQSD